jgi:LacI family transcriptional regulator
MSFHEEYVVDGKTVDIEGQQSGAAATTTLLKLRHRPDGIFCFNDSLAVGALQTLLERKIGVPQEIAIIGCGNIHYNDSFRVPLSSIDQQSHQIGKWAALLALDLIRSSEKGLTRQVLFEPAVVARESSRRR